jgi:hypothetical protein
MKVELPAATPPTSDELIRALQQRLPQYEVWARTRSLVIVEKSAAVGATVRIGKQALDVQANFPNMAAQIVFVLLLVGLGILLPLIVYFAAFHGRQKAVEKETVAALQAWPAGPARAAQPTA